MRGYLDHNATSPLAPEVIAAMQDAFAIFGNASSIHRQGSEARYAVEKARRTIAKCIGAAQPEELIFTSGGSESNALAIRGAAFAARRAGRGAHLITSAAEHKAVLENFESLRAIHGFEVTILGVDQHARAKASDLVKALRKDTVLVSLMLANNEVGSLQDVGALARIVHEHSGALFHTDAVQAPGRVLLDLAAIGVDLASIGCHKAHGPKGIGALYRRTGIALDSQIGGGAQEFGLRAGTENVSGIAGFAAAMKLSQERFSVDSVAMIALRERLWGAISNSIPPVVRNSPEAGCLPNTLNVSIPGQEGTSLVRKLDERGFSVSAGSACTSGGEIASSHVLAAMGFDESRCRSALRISLGRSTSEEEVIEFASALGEVAK